MKPTVDEKISVIIADDSTIFRTGLLSVLKQESQIAILDQACNGQELVSCVRTHKPDVVITDIRMPLMDGIQATSIIATEFPATGVIGLSMFDSADTMLRMINVGARGYILKTADSREIVKAVTAVFRNQDYYCNDTLSRMVAFSQLATKKCNLHDLTEKEIKIIKLICQQQSTKEIASKLDTTPRAVESAKERIQAKTGAKNMVGIALYAIAKTIVPLNDIQEFFQ
jgi:two-component system response regulator NreC